MIGDRAPFSLFAGVIALSMMATPALAADPTGTWLRDTGSSQIRIYQCGNGYCGKIVWLREPNDSSGNPRTDIENPDAAHRSSPLIGTQVIINMTPDGDSRWSGQVYKADEGKTYNGNMRMINDNTIALAGCVLGGIICRSGNLSKQQ